MKATHTEELFFPLYQSGAISIDEDGNVWRHKRWFCAKKTKKTRWIPIEPHICGSPTRKGYLCMGYHRRGEPCRCAFIHRIIWRCLVGPISGDMEINHKNGNHQDNRLENLELVTTAENNAHAVRTRLWHSYGNDCHFSKLKPVDAMHIIWALSEGMQGNHLAKCYGVRAQTVSEIKRGRSWRRVTDLFRGLQGKSRQELGL